MKYDRINDIEKLIANKHSVTNEALCETFGISMQTLRRDIDTLCKRGTVEKVYGGVIAKKNGIENRAANYSERYEEGLNEKIKIGQLASLYVEDDDVIFLDSGTTVYQMIPFLKERKNVIVLTHSLNAASALSKESHLKGILLGGPINCETNSVEVDVTKIPYRFDKAFIATVGITKNGCTNTDIGEARIKQYVMNHSSVNYILCDHTKFDVKAFNTFANIDEFKAIITDRKPPQWLDAYSKRKQIEIKYEK